MCRQILIATVKNFYFFSLPKNNFLPDILTDAKSINPAPIIESHSAFERFLKHFRHIIWLIVHNKSEFREIQNVRLTSKMIVNNKILKLVEPYPWSSVSETWEIYVKITIELFKIPTRPAFSRWRPSCSNAIAARPFRPNQRI